MALFLERFPEWRKYRDDALNHPPDPDTLERALAEIAELNAELRKHDPIDNAVPDNLAAQIEAAGEAPDDPLVATGLVASVGNILSALATKAAPVLKWCKTEVGDVGKMTWSGLKKTTAAAATSGIVGLAGAAGDIYFNKAQLLHSLAAQFPDKLGWLQKFLAAWGL